MPSLHFDWDEAAEQLARVNDDFGVPWQPNLGTGLDFTYAYRTSAAAPSGPAGSGAWIGGMPSGAGGFQKFDATQINLMELALALIEDVSGVTFDRVGSGTSGGAAFSNNADILFGNFTTGALTNQVGGVGYFSFWYDGSEYTRAGKAWFNATLPDLSAPAVTNSGLLTYLHEVLHTLAILHPGDYDAVGGGTPTYADDAEYIEDTVQYTVMSYFSETETGADYGGYSPMTLMLHDIAALQYLYGANTTTRAGNTIYGFGSNTGLEPFTISSATDVRIFTIWDAGGTDTLDLSGYDSDSVIDLRAEHFSSAGFYSPGNALIDNIAIARGVTVENGFGGSGDDTITGNPAANRLTGNQGADKLTGGGGADVLKGLAGSDVMNGGAGADLLTGGGGSDAFLFNTALAQTKIDEITDFSVSQDTIELDNAVMTGLGVDGLLTGARLFIGAAAHDANDRVIYNAATGALFYDSNGDRSGGATQIALLDAGLALTRADFLVV